MVKTEEIRIIYEKLRKTEEWNKQGRLFKEWYHLIAIGSSKEEIEKAKIKMLEHSKVLEAKREELEEIIGMKL
jgi:hypothetical protein